MSANEFTKGPLEAALLSEVEEKLRQHGIVFWLDVHGHYTALAERMALASEAGVLTYPVIPFRGSYLEMILALEKYGTELHLERVLIHLPGVHKDEVRKTPLLELYEVGHAFERALPTLITEHGVGYGTRAELQALAARKDLTLAIAEEFIAAKLSQREGGIEETLKRMKLEQVVDSVLTGMSTLMTEPTSADFDALRAYLHRHVGFDQEWAEEALGNLTETRSKDESPEVAKQNAMRVQLGAWLLCVEFAADFTRTPTTPHLAALRGVAEPFTKRCRELAGHLRSREPELYEALADEVEALIEDEKKTTTADDLGRIDTFRFEEGVILHAAIQALREGQWERVLAWTHDRVGDASFWLRDFPQRARSHQRLSHRWAWAIVEAGAQLGKATKTHAGLLVGARTLEEATERYAERGHEVDAAHRAFAQRWNDNRGSILPGDMHEVVAFLRKQYRDWADETTRAFTKLCDSLGFLPEPSLQQRTLFDEVIRPLAEKGEVIAVFMLDAWRYEMAVGLERSLRDAGLTPLLKPRLAELPTVTCVGMNALAPVAREGKLDAVVSAKGAVEGFRTGGFTVNSPKTRARAMGTRAFGESARLVELSAVVDATQRTLSDWVKKGPKMIVVAGLEIDGAGEAGFGLSTFEHTLSQVRAAWNQLSMAGVKSFVFTADHGFLLQDATTTVQPFGKKTDPSRRHIYSEQALRVEGSVPVSLSKLGYEGAEGYLLLREDTAVYETANANAPFVHGGNSLTERVVPVLVVTRKIARGPSDTSYVIEAKSLPAVIGASRMSLRIQDEANTPRSLGFSGVQSIRLALRVVDRSDVLVRVREVSQPAKLIGGELEVPVGAKWVDVTFVLDEQPNRQRTLGLSERVQIEIFHPDGVERVKPLAASDFFDVISTAVAAPKSRTIPPEAGSAPPSAPISKSYSDMIVQPKAEPATRAQTHWKDAIEDQDFVRVLVHIEAHGSINEQDLASMLGPRKSRAFAREFEKFAPKLPFRIHIQVLSGAQKVYVKDGGQ